MTAIRTDTDYIDLVFGGNMAIKVVFRAVSLLIVVYLSACASTGTGGRPIDKEAAAKYNAQLGNEYLRQGKVQLAKNKFEKALKQNPALASAHAGYGLLWGRLGDNKKADKHFKRALRSDPKNPNILNNYGTYLCGQDRFVLAEKQFLKALNDPLYETPEYAYTNAGRCSMQNSDFNKAEAYFGKALQANPHFPDALYRMAALKARQGDYRIANAYIQKFEMSGPGGRSPHTAETLWMAIRINSKLGNKNAVASYRLRLRRDFADSKQAKRLDNYN